MPHNRLRAACVVFLVLTGLMLAGMALGVPPALAADPVDATVYWEAGERMRAGGDELYAPGGWDNKSGLYLYPPGFAALCAPLTWLDDRPDLDPRDRSIMKPYPYPTMIRLWVALHAALWLAAVWLLTRMTAPVLPPVTAWPRPAIAAAATSSMFAAVVLDTYLGNINLLILLLLVTGLFLLHKDRRTSGGVVLGVAAMVKIMPIALLPLLLLTRQWRAAAGMVLGAALLALAPLPFTIAAHGAGRGLTANVDLHVQYMSKLVLPRLRDQAYRPVAAFAAPNSSPTAALHRLFGEGEALRPVTFDRDDFGPLLIALPKGLLTATGAATCIGLFAMAAALAWRRRDLVSWLGACGMGFTAASMANVLFWHYHLAGMALVGASVAARLARDRTSRRPGIAALACAFALANVPHLLHRVPGNEALNRLVIWGLPTWGLIAALVLAWRVLWRVTSDQGDNAAEGSHGSKPISEAAT